MHTLTIKLTDEQKQFLDNKITQLKTKIGNDIDVPVGLVIGKVIDKAIAFQEYRERGSDSSKWRGLRGVFGRGRDMQNNSNDKRINRLMDAIKKYNADSKE